MNNEEKKRQVPFGMSTFAIMRFVGNEITPERTYRHVLLQLDTKQKAMQECKFRRRRWEVEIAEINEKLDNPDTEKYYRMKLTIDLEEKQYFLEHEIKLIEDCAMEITTYEHILSQLPEFTREEFENGEKEYWTQRLLGDYDREMLSNGTVGSGTIDSLEQLGLMMGRLENGKIGIIEDFRDAEPKKARQLMNTIRYTQNLIENKEKQ
jgi:hypothetical protein